MAITRKGRRWVHDWRDNGQRKRKWFTSERAARRAARQLADRQANAPPRAKRNQQLAALAAQFTATKAATSEDNYQAIAHCLQELLATIPPNINAARLQANHLTEFRAALRPYKPNTRLKYERTARAFLRWCYRTGSLNTPLDELYPATPHLKPERRQTTADPATLQAITEAASAPATRRNASQPAIRFMIMLGREAGLRISEMARALCADWNRRAKLLTIRSSKNHPARTNPANPDLAAYLDALIPPAAPPTLPISALVAPNLQPLTKHALRYHWNKARRAAKLPNLNPHDLRRTWATEHAEHAPLPILMDLAGWQSPATALHYIALNSPEAKARAVARAWHANHPEPLEIRELNEEPPTPPKPN